MSTLIAVPDRREIEPLDPPMVPFAVGGIVAWAVAGLILLAFRPTLVEQGHEEWLRICLAGFLLGFPGLAIMIKHDANRRRRRAQAAARQPASPSAESS
jgi:Protein of unknown function (DUF2530)